MASPEEKIYRGSVNITPAEYPAPYTSDNPVTPEQVPIIASESTAVFIASLLNAKFADLRQLFVANCYYRDFLVASPDFRTIHGVDQIVSYLDSSSRIFRSISIDETRKPELLPLNPTRTINCIEINLQIETDIAKVRGLLRLVQDAQDGKWKIFTLHTVVTQWIGHAEEAVFARRPFGAEPTVPKPKAKTRILEEENPAVLIVGEQLIDSICDRKIDSKSSNL